MSLRGSQSEDTTGLVYYGLRYYNPETGRFINRDPIGLSGGHNLYAFVGNNPMNAWDVRGMFDSYDDNPNAVMSLDPYTVWSNIYDDGHIGYFTDPSGNMYGFDHSSGSFYNFGSGGSSVSIPDHGSLLSILQNPYATDADIEKWFRDNGFPVGNTSKSSDSSKEVTQPDKEKDVSPELPDRSSRDLSNLVFAEAVLHPDLENWPDRIVGFNYGKSDRIALFYDSTDSFAKEFESKEGKAVIDSYINRAGSSFFAKSNLFADVAFSSEYESKKGAFDVVYLFSHGDQGDLLWGKSRIPYNDPRWASVVNSMKPNGYLVLHICLAGQEYAENLALYWGIHVIASPNYIYGFMDIGYTGRNSWYQYPRNNDKNE